MANISVNGNVIVLLGPVNVAEKSSFVIDSIKIDPLLEPIHDVPIEVILN